MNKEQLIREVCAWLGSQIDIDKARKIKYNGIPDYSLYNLDAIYTLYDKEININCPRAVADLLGLDILEEEWDGNRVVEHRYNKVYFIYCGYKFYALERIEVENENK